MRQRLSSSDSAQENQKRSFDHLFMEFDCLSALRLFVFIIIGVRRSIRLFDSSAYFSVPQTIFLYIKCRLPFFRVSVEDSQQIK
jgi:hypothetical protein